MEDSPLHSFAVCAYKESKFLPECIESLLRQNDQKSEIFIATSTPSDWLFELAQSYDLPVFVNAGETGIGQDWNFAYSCARGKYVTIAHQDDVYAPDYAKRAVEMLEAATRPILFFCDYGELKGDNVIADNTNLRIKRLLLHGLKSGKNAQSIRVRRRSLSLGCAICCPSVTLATENCPSQPYQTRMKCSLDWDTWESLSRLEGSFVYAPEVLMYHRIHEESATTQLISDSTRPNEDREMYERFWPKPIAHVLARLYELSLRGNNV